MWDDVCLFDLIALSSRSMSKMSNLYETKDYICLYKQRLFPIVIWQILFHCHLKRTQILLLSKD